MPRRFDLERISDWCDHVRAGEKLLLSGVCYTARDAAHKRLLDMIARGERLPFDLDGATIYYAGPSATPPGKVIGSCGPTTSSRMDGFTLPLLDRGLACMIGKGSRSAQIKEEIASRGALYLCAVGGCGALYASHIVSSRVIAFDDLGCEAIRELVLRDFPVYCAYDLHGGDLFA